MTYLDEVSVVAAVRRECEMTQERQAVHPRLRQLQIVCFTDISVVGSIASWKKNKNWV